MLSLRSLAKGSVQHAATTVSTSIAPLAALPQRFVSNLTKARTLYNLKKRPQTSYPAPVVPQHTETKAGEGTTGVKYDHPMPAYTNPAKPNLSIANSELFAIINVNGVQYKVGKDDALMVNHIPGVDVGDQLAFDQVLLVGSRDMTVIGTPLVPAAVVTATVEQQTLTQAVNVYKMRRRTGYHRMKRHRDMITMLRINDVTLDANSPNQPVSSTEASAATVSAASSNAKPAEATPSA